LNPIIDKLPNSKCYLTTIAELEKNAVTMLGTMSEGSYEMFEAKMRKIAQDARIIKPLMVIGIKYKKGFLSFVPEQPYPIKTLDQWTINKKNSETMCEYIPKVFVIDGTKFKIMGSGDPMVGWKMINNNFGVAVKFSPSLEE
jgi:hypothetical protein